MGSSELGKRQRSVSPSCCLSCFCGPEAGSLILWLPVLPSLRFLWKKIHFIFYSGPWRQLPGRLRLSGPHRKKLLSFLTKVLLLYINFFVKQTNFVRLLSQAVIRQPLICLIVQESFLLYIITLLDPQEHEAELLRQYIPDHRLPEHRWRSC